MQRRSSKNGSWGATDAEAFCTLLMGGLKQYGVIYMDLDGILRGWSEGAHLLTGFSPDDVLGKSAALIFTPEDVARDLHVHELNSARLLGAVEDERWHMRKDGARFWASGVTVRLDSGGAPVGLAKLFRDATHLRLRMDALDNEVRQMRKQQADRDVFLATIAHELRNPLHPMSMAARLLAGPFEATRHEQAVKTLDRQLRFMERLVEDLIDMTRIGQGKFGLDYRPVKLQSLLQEALAGCAEAATAKDILLNGVFPEKPIDVECDPGRINQVLVNLLNNAIKFTPPGGRVTLLGNIDQTHFTVKVQDTGIGIAPNLQPAIFEMFTQAEPSDTGRGQGLGIGLALVKQIVSLHRGTVEVRSEGAGKGSEFFIRIPVSKAEAPNQTEPPA
jgi:two-component system CheB/CheR fusion protein